MITLHLKTNYNKYFFCLVFRANLAHMNCFPLPKPRHNVKSDIDLISSILLQNQQVIITLVTHDEVFLFYLKRKKSSLQFRCTKHKSKSQDFLKLPNFMEYTFP